MGSLFRSEPMKLCQVFLQAESAFECMSELGEMGMAQFRDLNPESTAFQRKFVTEVRRCDEMSRQLRYLHGEMKRENIKVIKSEDVARAPPPRTMVDIEGQMSKLEVDMLAINGNEETLRQNFLELAELKHILHKTQTFFDERDDVRAASVLHMEAPVPTVELNGRPMKGGQLGVPGGDSNARPRTVSNAALDLQLSRELEDLVKTDQPVIVPLASDLSFVTGVIARRRLVGFERMLWRACRGNIFVKWEEIEEELIDPSTREPVTKSVFIIFFQGERLKLRVKKICDGFHAKVYPCPATTHERRQMSAGVLTRLEDIKTVLNETADHRVRTLVHAAKDMQRWHQQVQRLKSVYHSLNLLNIDVTQKCLIGECWVPDKDLDGIRESLKRGDDIGGATVPSILNVLTSEETPPTFFRTNKLTRGYQNIVDSYGIANYGEVNPAPWTVITFPFLFAVMFGDVGHGMIMFLSGLTLVLAEKKLAKLDLGDIFQTLFGGRYVVMMMGMFSMYTGFHYNEIYAKAWNVAGTGWAIPPNGNASGYDKLSFEFLSGKTKEIGLNVYHVDLDPAQTQKPDHVYWAGIDPIWSLAENRLLFIDSFKMKTSVILGISQMMFGVVLSLINHVHFKDYLRIWAEFIPEVLFLSSLFVYMCVLIVVKWLLFSVDRNCDWPVHADKWDDSYAGVYPGTHCAPSLLIGIINMALPTSSKTYGFSELRNASDPFSGGQESHYANETCHNLDYKEMADCNLQAWFPYQKTLEPILVLMALVCVPWLLFVRPCVLRWRYGRETKLVQRQKAHSADASSSSSSHDNPAYDAAADGMLPVADGARGREESQVSQQKLAKTVKKTEEEEEGFNMGDILVYQAIHTIEFALGCISHTASYLRLWALSLAHSQLSEVLWTMVMRMAFTMGGGFSMNFVGGIFCYIVFLIFSTLTIAILVFMEGLSAFLHSLRLHWVEFQSKFYLGQGEQFMPFTFENLSNVIGEDEVTIS